jgi:hypothetical protein
MERAGVRVARINFDWRTVQKTRDGEFRWHFFDNYVQKFSEHGIQLVAQVFGTPPWLAPSFVQAPVFSKDARQLWRKFVSAAAHRYARHGTFWAQNPTVPYRPIKIWEVWDEENAPGFFQPKPSPRRYLQLLKISSKAVHRADGQATIMLGGMFESTGRDGAIISWKFLNRLYSLGAGRWFDAVGVHPYSPRLSGFKYQLERTSRALHNNHHGRTPMYIDEIAWGSARGGSPQNKGPHGQAAMLRRAFTYVLRHRAHLNIKMLMWWPFRDSRNVPPSCVFCKTVGLVNRKGHPKPAWTTYRRFASH